MHRRFSAEYSGDNANEAVSSECNAPNEQSVVNDRGDGGDGSGGGNNNDHRNRHHNRFHHNRFHHNDNAVHKLYEKIVEERVINETIPNKGKLANTGKMPLARVAFLSLTIVGLGVSILRSAIRRER